MTLQLLALQLRQSVGGRYQDASKACFVARLVFDSIPPKLRGELPRVAKLRAVVAATVALEPVIRVAAPSLLILVPRQMQRLQAVVRGGLVQGATEPSEVLPDLGVRLLQLRLPPSPPLEDATPSVKPMSSPPNTKRFKLTQLR
eukprot:m.50390 g.50390  ORF g.50390 m.50390 type:complete len:144 (-) comp9009_c0_seq2:5-436(-)